MFPENALSVLAISLVMQRHGLNSSDARARINEAWSQLTQPEQNLIRQCSQCPRKLIEGDFIFYEQMNQTPLLDFNLREKWEKLSKKERENYLVPEMIAWKKFICILE